MIEDYISRLQEENKEKLRSYDKEMQDLTQELSVTEKLLSQLQKEKQDDKNIFSPRAMDSGRDQEIQKAEDQVKDLKQRLDYVSQMVETEMKNAEEYRELAQEAAKETAEKEAATKEAAEKEHAEKVSTENEAAQESVEEKGSKEDAEKVDAMPDSLADDQNDQELLDFLNSIYKKIEFSFSLVSGNKNRCRSELKNVERMIRSYEDSLKRSENS